MGCVTSEGTNDKPKRSTKDLALARDSMGNHLDDVGIARRKDQKEIDNSLTKQIEDVSKKNRELNRDVEKLKRENQMKKKESEVSSQDKQRKIKQLEDDKNREIDRLRKELEREKQKQKDNQKSSSQQQGKAKQKPSQAIGLVSLQKSQSLCQECFYKLPRYTTVDPKMNECHSCRGYGVSMERFPYGANPSCDRSLCFTTGWEKVRSMRLCSVCGGQGGHLSQGRPYIAGRMIT